MKATAKKAPAKRATGSRKVSTPALPTGALGHFPAGFEPRALQTSLIEQIAAAFASGKRFVIVEAPPGVGKSHIAITFANYYREAYLCTVTKQLQDQYVQTFPELVTVLKGRAAFKCERAGGTCELGGVLFKGRDACVRVISCPYADAKLKALKAPLMVANYFSFIFNVPYGEDGDGEEGMGGWRPLLICDEAHDIERVMLDHVSVEIKTNSLPVEFERELPVVGDQHAPLNPEGYFAYLSGLQATLSEALSDEDHKADMSPEQVTAAERLFGKISFVLLHRADEEWIVELREKSDGFTLKPLTVASFCEGIFKFGERVLLMSATVIDAKRMAQYLGLKWEDCAYISAPCPFKAENRQVIAGNLPMTYKHRDQSWPAMISLIARVLDHHKTEKGLLLAQSNEMLKFIMQRLDRSHAQRLILAFGEDREAKLRMHMGSSQPTVLAASGYWEGLDLKGELSRFQILPAIPRLMWRGQIEARAKLDPVWYRWVTYCKLIQGLGRSVRSEDDHAVTYVFDADLRREATRANGSMIPAWLKEAIAYSG